MFKAILVTGATGKQGSSVIDGLITCEQASDFLILAVTRDTTSQASKRLMTKAKNIRLVHGNLNDTKSLFEEALRVADGQAIWGVFSVQISMGRGVTLETEVKQGTDLVAESARQGVRQFVYSSVDRGGDEVSWNNETPVHHFKSKYRIEHFLKENAGQMGWTILRPVAFMDNLEPGIPPRIFLTALRDTLNGRLQQWVAVSDIGVFAAKAFQQPQQYHHRSLGLAGDELTFDDLQETMKKIAASPPTPVLWFLGSLMRYMLPDMDRMLQWFGAEGYQVNIPALKKLHPGLKDFETWLREDSGFQVAAM